MAQLFGRNRDEGLWGMVLSKRRVRRLFIAMFLFLPVQFALGEMFDEHYPAVILPGFGPVATPGDVVDSREFELSVRTAEGKTRDTAVTELFPEVPGRRARGFLRQIAPVDGEPKQSDDLREWLRNNLRKSTGVEPVSLEVRWIKRRFRRSNWELVERRQIKRHEIVLTGDAGEIHSTRN